ncbi:MAG: molybdopterin-dependent oxidoreductase [Ignavibacteriales bacterium]|nr:molybdopterin-dependent oxidoreductase [Ignavibacteriales bacterium]
MTTDEVTGLDFMEHSFSNTLPRRDFLKLAGGGILLFFTVGDLDLLAQQRRGLPTDFNAFLKIGEDGRVVCYTGKIEMGQGIITSLRQMLAEELDVALESVDIVMGDTDLCPWDMGTFGSMSTRIFGPALRKAGAEARAVMLELASEYLKTPIDSLTVENGVVYDKSNKQNRIAYAILAKGKKIERRAAGSVSVKKPSEFKIIGKSLTRRDAKEKVTGKAKFTSDIRISGMLYAKIVRPPAHDSKLVSVDVSEAKNMKNVQVIQEGDFIAVLHQYPDVAEEALSKIKVQFEKPELDLNEINIFDHLLKVAPEGKVVTKGGDIQKGESESAAMAEHTYLDGYKAHAAIEPHAALVHIEGNKANVWASTQNPFTAKEEVAKALGFSSEHVRMMPVFVGGGFGGKTTNLQIIDAARLAKLTGKPVQVAYTRKEEFFFDSFRPAAVVKIKSGIDSKGKMNLWDYHVYFAGSRGAEQFYDIPHHRTTAYNASWTGAAGTHPFATGAWRAPSNNTNTFARESQIDIMAAKAGIDPIEFRIQNLADKRMQNVLRSAAKQFGWKPAKAPSGRGFGVACGIDAGTLVATIVEVKVNKNTGEVKVIRLVCAQDMGLVVNPEGAKIQMEGCLTMGLGYALKEDVRFTGKEILDVNFDTYEIPRFSWLPKIETIIIDNQESDPQGGGEPAIVTVGAVVANAIFDAVGVRVYQQPMTPERVKEALKKG